MTFTKLVPNIFYADLNDGLRIFVDCLQFSILYDSRPDEHALCVVERDAIKLNLVQDAEFAAKDRPEIAIETDDIHAAYKAVSERNPELLHPNSKEVSARPWGSLEFAMLDASGVCVIFRQWPAATNG